MYKYNGSFSAEHGIGKMKIKELEKYSSHEGLIIKTQIKKLFDPKGIMSWKGIRIKWQLIILQLKICVLLYQNVANIDNIFNPHTTLNFLKKA